MPIPPDLQIFYPNGGVSAHLTYIWDGSKPVAWDGSVSVSVTSSGSAIEDGVNNTIKATVFDLANSNPLSTQIVDANGDAITSFGGGTQYAEGATTLPATGTVALWRKAGNALTAVSATDPLPVTGPLTDTQLRATAVPISAASLPLPTGAATAANQQTDALTDTQLRATPVPISGTVTATQSTASNLKVEATVAAAQTIAVTQGTATNLKAEVVGTGTFATQAACAGDVAHDSADSGNPVKVGGKAANAFPTAVANADRANFITDLFGRLLVTPIDGAMQVWKSANYTTAQTGVTIWDPTSGKKIAITSISIGTYGTTAARLILWIGANGDTTYSAGTDQLVFAGSYAPSTTSKPGTVLTFPTPIFVTTADYELHITTDAALSVDIAVYGYEW